jgi:hypothetical protein
MWNGIRLGALQGGDVAAINAYETFQVEEDQQR